MNYKAAHLPIFLSILAVVLLTLAHAQALKIKPGTVLEIIVYGHEELSRTVTVQTDGTINFPFLEGVPIDGLTVKELREILLVQIGKYVERKPIITVSFLDTYLITIIVLGQVKRPGAMRIPQNSTVLGAIGEAGGIIPGAKLSEVKILREKQDKKENHTVDLEAFYLTSDFSLLPPLKDGDVIIVPGHPGATSIKVIGEVRLPGNYEIFSNIENVLDAIFKAGGFTTEADIHRIRIISGSKSRMREFEIDLDEKMKYNQYEEIPAIYPGDVIYVPKKNHLWKSFVTIMRDIASFATLYIIFRYGRRL